MVGVAGGAGEGYGQSRAAAVVVKVGQRAWAVVRGRMLD